VSPLFALATAPRRLPAPLSWQFRTGIVAALAVDAGNAALANNATDNRETSEAPRAAKRDRT
jgi:hypothetical protein